MHLQNSQTQTYDGPRPNSLTAAAAPSELCLCLAPRGTDPNASCLTSPHACSGGRADMRVGGAAQLLHGDGRGGRGPPLHRRERRSGRVPRQLRRVRHAGLHAWCAPLRLPRSTRTPGPPAPDTQSSARCGLVYRSPPPLRIWTSELLL